MHDWKDPQRPTLEELARMLSVGGWLDLSGCTGLSALPDGLSVGGRIYGAPK